MRPYFDEIVAFHRKRAIADMENRNFEELFELAKEKAKPEKSFQFNKALKFEKGTHTLNDGVRNPDIKIIAEIKRQSPSKGDFGVTNKAGEAKNSSELAELAKDFEMAGASAISVLTDEEFFKGSLNDLKAVEGDTTLPILRKDFTMSGLDIVDAFNAGASAVLLIVAALDYPEIINLAQIASRLGLDSIIEAHNKNEVRKTLALRDTLPIGEFCVVVNQRDLKTFEEYPDRALELAIQIHNDVISIAASCINSGKAVREIADAGYNAVLVGEHLMKADDPPAALKSLLS